MLQQQVVKTKGQRSSSSGKRGHVCHEYLTQPALYLRWWTVEREEPELDDHAEAGAGSSEEGQLWGEIFRQAGRQAEIGLSDAAKSSPGGNGEEELGAGHRNRQ